uniref:FABP domain-containing protein n=1 Tax=Globodera pallida TaxID=36090 RepID=A0A183BSQ0_GLOPA
MAVKKLVLFSLLLVLLHVDDAIFAEDDAATEIPQKFYGAFKLDHSDNWDDYLVSKGYNDPEVRKKVELPRFTRILYRHPNGTYRMMVGTGVEGSKWVKGSKKHSDCSFQLNKASVCTYWDGNKHELTFTYDAKDERLTERHVRLDGTGAPEVFNYKIDSDNNMELFVDFKNGKLTHHYVRTD